MIAVSNATQTIYVGQTATFNGTLTASGTYNSPVNLSCTAGSTSPPATCAATTTPVAPTSGGTAFSVTASGAAGAYNFNVQGVGTDAGSTLHSAPVDLSVVDFTVSAPSPASIAANIPSASNSTSFTVTPVGPLTDTIR